MVPRLCRLLLAVIGLCAIVSGSACNCAGEYQNFGLPPGAQTNAANIRIQQSAIQFIEDNFEAILRANFQVDDTGQSILIYMPEAIDSSTGTFCDEEGQYGGRFPPCTYALRLRDGCMGPGSQDPNGICQPELGVPRETMRSYIKVGIDELRTHVTIQLDPSNGADTGAIRLIINDLQVDAYLGVYLNLSDVVPDNLLTGKVACLFQPGHGATNSFVINNLDISIAPQVQNINGTPEFFASSLVRALDVSDISLTASALPNDPACQNANQSVSCAQFCNTTGEVLSVISTVFNTVDNVIAPAIPYIVTPLANVVLGFLWGKPLNINVSLPGNLQPYIPKGVGQPLNLSITPGAGAFAVTQQTPFLANDPTLGMNVPLDLGAEAALSSCAGPATQPVSDPAELPALTGTITLPDPQNPGSTYVAPYDLGMTVSQSFLNQLFYAARNSGLICLQIGSNPGGLLSSGAFVPTAGLLYLLAPPLQRFAPSSSPILVQMAPGSVSVRIGTNSVTGTDVNGNPIVDPLIALTLSGVDLEFQIYANDRYVRAFAITVDMTVGLTLHPTDDGNLTLGLVNLTAGNLVATYNPFMPGFDFSNLTQVVFQLLSSELSANSLTFSLPVSEAIQQALGVPFDIKILDVRQDGGGGFMSAYVKLCNDSDIADPTNKACYVIPAPTVTASVQSVGFAATTNADVLALRANRVPTGQVDIAVSNDQLEYQISTDGGLYSGFQKASNGHVSFTQPTLQVLGHHQLSLRQRWPGQPFDQAQVPLTLDALVDPERPLVTLVTSSSGTIVETNDLVTPIEKMRFALVNNGHIGSWMNESALHDLLPSASVGTAVVAMDEAGNQSDPVRLDIAAVTAPSAAHGCQSVAASSTLDLLALAVAFGLIRRARRSM